MLVVDASVVVNAMLSQRFTAEAVRWMETSVPIMAPDFMRLEVANALWKIENAGLIDDQEAELVWGHFLAGDIRFIPDLDHLDRAREIARSLDHPAYDCIYLAVAEAHKATLVTADRRLYQVAAARPDICAVSWVEDHPPQP